MAKERKEQTNATRTKRNNVKVKFQDGKPVLAKEKKNKKDSKFSMKKQMERKHQPIPRTVEEWGGHRGLIEYQMGRDMAEDVLALRKGKDRGIDPQKWLCDFVNEQMSLIGYCIKVVIAG